MTDDISIFHSFIEVLFANHKIHPYNSIILVNLWNYAAITTIQF